MAADTTFLGTGWRFPPTFGYASRGAAMVAEEDDIRESLHILFATTPGERVMQPDYGCDLRSLAFASMDTSTITALRDMIRRAILFFEPRIDLETIDVNEERAFEGVLFLTLVYRVRTTNSRSNMVYPFYFLEGTNLAP
ncbi:MAG: hypothetical protein H6R10_1060 [Rhodocyclaceae bacterium]|nr:hypothetical protein [Rhodocyclaceae bacterium]